MNKKIEDSKLKKIKEELHSATFSKEGEDNDLDTIIDDIAHHYSIFQTIITDTFQENFSFEFKGRNILFNDLISARDGADRITFNYSTYRDNFEQRFASLIFSGAYSADSDPITFCPDDATKIRIYMSHNDIELLRLKIQSYLYENLKKLNDTYADKIPNINNFLMPFSQIVFSLEKSGIFVDSLFEENKKYKKTELYNILNNSKEIINLSIDVDIEERLEIINKIIKKESNILKKT